MANGFLVFDVETPNSKNDRICQIGFIKHSGGAHALDSRVYLVNPDAPFDDRCCGIHGIHAKDVLDKPTFADLWESELSEVFCDSVLVSHNASFDLGVLSKTLDYYGLRLPEIQYIDTLEMSRKHYPSLENYRLETVAKFIGHIIPKTHDALCDANAAYYILVETLKRFGNSALSPKLYTQAATIKRVSIDDFKEILEYIMADGKITFEEAWLLNEWLKQNIYSVPKALAEELLDLLFKIILDGTIDVDEEDFLKKSILTILSPAGDTDTIEFNNKSFVLTGDFRNGTKPEVEDFIKSKGGVIDKNVTKTTSYVVVGEYGSDKYAHGTYGGKVIRAMELQEKGLPIKIIKEEVLYPRGK